MKQKIALVLRGHIRNSLNDQNLSSFLNRILEYVDFDIYVQSWDTCDAKRTWTSNTRGGGPRKKIIKNKKEIVTPQHIFSYFDDDIIGRIKSVKILNEDNIDLKGNLRGSVGKSNCPLVSWKRMWHGIDCAISSIPNDVEYTYVLNTRFDILDKSLINFCNKSSPRNRRPHDHFTFVKNFSNVNRTIGDNSIYSLYGRVGCDNFYLSKLNFMRTIVTGLNLELDSILDRIVKRNLKTGHQEVIFKYYCEEMGKFVYEHK